MRNLLKYNDMEDKLYFPSNGTEGDWFTDKWCANCRKDTGLRGGITYCPILNKSLIEGRPIKQWIYKDDKATCTSFVDYKTYKRKHKRPIKNQLTIHMI
jgi:hypothetical protein